MGRFLAGVAATLLLMTGGFFIWRAQADRGAAVPAPPPAAGTAAPLGLVDLAGPPAASERTREEKRFARYDKDRNGAVGRDEYFAARRKNFAKLDVDGDGKLGFEEYAAKAVAKFGAADKDCNGALNAAEFATTRVVRKSPPRCACRPSVGVPAVAAADEPGEE